MKNNTMSSFIAISVVFLALGVTVARAGVAVPYADGFETNDPGPLPVGAGWTTNGEGSVTVVAGQGVSGGKGCSIVGDDLILNLTSTDADNAWADFFCKPTAYDDQGGNLRPAVGSDSLVFYFNTNRELWACTGNGSWDQVGGTPVVPEFNFDSFGGVAVHLDYGSKTWDIYYVTSSVVGAVKTKINTLPLAMLTASASNRLTQVEIYSGSTTYVDQVQVSLSYTPIDAGVASPSNQVAGKTITLGSGATELNNIAQYFSGESARLDTDLGAALLRILPVGATIYIYGTPTWNVYTVTNFANAKVWRKDDGVDPYDPLTPVYITKTAGFHVNLNNGTLSNVTYELVGSYDSSNSDPVLESGWNMLAWPHGNVGNLNSDVRLTTGLAAPGDRLFIDTSPYLVYVSGKGWCVRGNPSNIANVEIPLGKAFWLKRNAVGTGTWDVY